MTPHALISPARLAGVPLLLAQSDERLVDLVRAGNDAAFEAIVGRYRRPLLRYCSGFMSEARAEDTVQTAFVRALDSLRSSSDDVSLRPWLYRIVHNTALNALRDRSLRHEELPADLDGVERPDQAFEKSERLRDVVAAVGALPSRQRDAMVLRELEGRSYEEIASELGVSDGSVRALLNRARTTLRTGMTALTPFALLARVPWGASPGESVAARVAELCAGGAGTAVVTKVCATAIVTGAVVGGVASSPSGGIDDGRARAERGPATQVEPAVPSEAPSRDSGSRQANAQGAAGPPRQEATNEDPARARARRDDDPPAERDRRGREGADPDLGEEGGRDDRRGPRGGEHDGGHDFGGPGDGWEHREGSDGPRGEDFGPSGGGGSPGPGGGEDPIGPEGGFLDNSGPRPGPGYHSGDSGSGYSGSGSDFSGDSGSSGPSYP